VRQSLSPLAQSTPLWQDDASSRVARRALAEPRSVADIVLDDADFEAKLPAASFVCMHAGQGCAMLTRLLIPRSRYDEAIALTEQWAAANGIPLQIQYTLPVEQYGLDPNGEAVLQSAVANGATVTAFISCHPSSRGT